MLRNRIALIGSYVFIMTLSAQQASMAGRCSDYPESDILWCDDFDNYCVDGEPWTGYPPFPTICPIGSVVDNDAFYARWPLADNSDPDYITMSIDDSAAYAENDPFYLYMHRGTIGRRANQVSHNIEYAVRHKDATKNAVNGTYNTPLILDVMYTFPEPSGQSANDPFYTELRLGNDHAPTDYIVSDCAPELAGPYPIICQQYRAGSGIDPNVSLINDRCGPLSETIHSVIAVGLFSFMDPIPCDVETGRNPTRYHAVIFDGKAWRELRSNAYPGSGDFNIAPDGVNIQKNRFKLTVRDTQFIVEHWNPVGWKSIALIPRQYLGPFDTIAHGVGPGCQIDPVTHECTGPREPLGAFMDQLINWQAWWPATADSMVLTGGVPDYVSHEGACCHSNGICQVMDEQSCGTLEGVYGGNSTTCDQALCCPTPAADSNRDHDVDMEDFAAFQRCYTTVTGSSLSSACKCFDRTGDGDVDADDLLDFANCATGPGVSFDVANVPTGCTP